jgi:hypothetical protein
MIIGSVDVSCHGREREKERRAKVKQVRHERLSDDEFHF